MATRKRKSAAASKSKPASRPKPKAVAAAAAEAVELPSPADVNEAVTWQLAVASVYAPDGDSAKLAAQASEAAVQAKTKRVLQAAIDASNKLREHIQQLHRDAFQANVIIDWLKENSRREGAVEQLRRMMQSLTGKAFKPAQAKNLVDSAKSSDSAKVVSAVTKLLGLSAVIPAWLGYQEPLRDENARRSVLHLVVVDLLHYSAADYDKVLEVLGLTPEESEAAAEASA